MTIAVDLILTHKYHPHPQEPVQADLKLPLTAAERQKSRQRLELETGQAVHFNLPRGSHIHPNDYFQTADDQTLVQVTAKPEAVITVTAPTSLLLLKAAYHLGNRHVPLEVQQTYLRFSPDHVLEGMLSQLGLQLQGEIVPFFPEEGAYGHHH
ncbi:urease accessory protein UreE [Picosynechococcus sp. NKBG15041c]|uniref:urease accessory protein UreE n=1 Tax=Picosynechococcus sp. NKBG15041c TaxID=1407650 RepID=UPI000464A12E|nr:urease accessory protein UreE [Picosynechococcus sp. NKBG15041c]